MIDFIDQVETALLYALTDDAVDDIREFISAHHSICKLYPGLALIALDKLRDSEIQTFSEFRESWNDIWNQFWTRRSYIFARALIRADHDLIEATARKIASVAEFKISYGYAYGEESAPVAVENRAVHPDGTIIDLILFKGFATECPICLKFDSESVAFEGVCKSCLSSK